MRQILIIALVVACLFTFFGCGWDDPVTETGTETGTEQQVLLAPRGVTSQTGDRQVVVWWYATYQDGVQGYTVYRSNSLDGTYEAIGSTGPEEESFTDNSVQNGTTYYYAVAARASDGRESDLSYENVEDTPRPEGVVTLHDWYVNPDASGFDFSNPAGAQHYDFSTTDIYFAVDIAKGSPYVYSDTDCLFQDMGYKDSIGEVDRAPLDGYLTLFQEVAVGHVYAVYSPDRHYALFRVNDMLLDWVLVEPEEVAEGAEEEQPEVWDISQAWMQIVWAVQLQIDNPELAPMKPR